MLGDDSFNQSNEKIQHRFDSKQNCNRSKEKVSNGTCLLKFFVYFQFNFQQLNKDLFAMGFSLGFWKTEKTQREKKNESDMFLHGY